MTGAGQVWGLADGEFLALYGAGVAALGVICAFVANLGPRDGGEAPAPDLDVHELAMLGGGPQLAITVAASTLYRDGALNAGPAGTLAADGDLGEGAHPLQRVLFDAVRRARQITSDKLRREVEGTEALARMEGELIERGLLREGSMLRLARGLWWLAVLLWLLAVVRLVAVVSADEAQDASWSTIALMFAVWLGCAMGVHLRPRHRQTPRGRSVLARMRAQLSALRETPPRQAIALATALFGAAVLWDAEPELAQALGVPREAAGSGWDGDACGAGCGGGGCGCGGCGGCG